jgi:hypothetical protein
MDHGDQGPHDDGRATPTGGPPDDWDKRFTAIVSGISGDMRWEAGVEELDEEADQRAADDAAQGSGVRRAPDSIWDDATSDTADDRRLRREMRRAERAASLAAFRQAQEELAAAREADTEHYVPPEPPPMPRLKRRTVGAIALIVMGLVLVVFPALLPASFELIAVLGALLILGGGALLATGIRRHRSDDGWDDGSRV